MRRGVKKYLGAVIIIFILLPLFSVVARADSRADARESADELLSDFFDIIPEGQSQKAEEGLGALSIDALAADILAAMRSGVRESSSFLFLLLGISLVLGAASALLGDSNGVVLGGITVVGSVTLLGSLLPLVSEIQETFNSVLDFFSSLIPIIASMLALSGGGASSAVSSSGMLLTLRLFGGISAALLPIVAAIFVGSALMGLSSDLVGGALDAPKRWLVKGTGLLTALLGGFISMQTAIASASDSAAIRAARYAASGAIPVVGQTVSGALATLSGGLGYARGVIGGGSVAVIISLTLAPLIKLLIYKLCFFLSGLLLEVFPSGVGGKCISALSSALDGLIATYSLGAVIFIFQIVLALRCSAQLI